MGPNVTLHLWEYKFILTINDYYYNRKQYFYYLSYLNK